ncbi:MAG: hypothetical protein AB8I08_05875 [Sandaracinaceae bacterium]
MTDAQLDAETTAATDFCARCGVDINPTTAAYSGDGLVCKSCENAEYARANRPGFTSDFSALGWGALSLACNPFFVCSFMAVTRGWAELQEARSYTAHGQTPPDPSMGSKAILGMVLGAFYPLLFVGMIGLLVVMSLVGAVFAPEPSYEPYGYGGGYDPYEYDPQAYDPPSYDVPSYDPPPSDPADGLGIRGLGAVDPVPEPEPDNRVELTASRPLRAQLVQHTRRASELGLTPYVYAHADWCGPCRAVARYEDDPRMQQAFSGVYLIGADVDVIDDAALGQVGIHVRGIPAWYGVDGRGSHDERTITGSAWGDDVPSNMAPALGAFFAGE